MVQASGRTLAESIAGRKGDVRTLNSPRICERAGVSVRDSGQVVGSESEVRGSIPRHAKNKIIKMIFHTKNPTLVSLCLRFNLGQNCTN